MAEVILMGKDLVKQYVRGKREVINALNHVDCEFERGKLYMIMGPSGSGKSTLLNVLSGLDKPTEGKVIFEDEDISQWDEERLAEFRRKNVGFVFQSWELIPTMTALENVEAPLYPLKMKSREIRSQAISLIKQVGLYERMDHFPTELSGGEQQRIAIARALISKPKVIFADEPTGNLDEDAGQSILRLLKSVTRRGTTVIVATHNTGLRSFADVIYKMQNGRLSG